MFYLFGLPLLTFLVFCFLRPKYHAGILTVAGYIWITATLAATIWAFYLFTFHPAESEFAGLYWMLLGLPWTLCFAAVSFSKIANNLLFPLGGFINGGLLVLAGKYLKTRK